MFEPTDYETDYSTCCSSNGICVSYIYIQMLTRAQTNPSPVNNDYMYVYIKVNVYQT